MEPFICIPFVGQIKLPKSDIKVVPHLIDKSQPKTKKPRSREKFFSPNLGLLKYMYVTEVYLSRLIFGRSLLADI